MKMYWLSSLMLLALVGCGGGGGGSNSGSNTSGGTPAPAPAPAAPAISAEDEARRVTDPVGKFSYIPPKGWEYTDFSGMKFKISRGAAADGFAPNINVVDEAYAGDMDSYLKANEVGVVKMLPKCVVLSKGDFSTHSGLQGKVMVVENEQYNMKLRQTFYIFGQGNMKYVITNSCLAKDGDKMAPLFEWSMKTFKF